MADDLLLLLDRFAQIGATAAGGVRRLAASSEDGAARRLFAEEAVRRGATLHVDPIGNMFATFATAPDSQTAIFIGSHLDSQPTGGRFDGSLGVLAGLVAADALYAERIPARHNLTVVNWTNEEGARFQPSLIGSSVFVGKYRLDQALKQRDRSGFMLGDELEAIGFKGTEALHLTPVRYLELHIEQGGFLEKDDLRIGAVSSSWAAHKLTLCFVGVPCHTGPTSMHVRRDAMRAAAFAITEFHRLMEREARDADLHWSAAKIVAEPDSPNVVASRVTVWFEVRNPTLEVAVAVGDRFALAIRPEIERQGVEIEVHADERRPGIPLDPRGIELTLEVAKVLSLPAIRMMSIAGHDAFRLQELVPSNLVFVPSVGGLSHNEAELTLPEDLRNGCRVVSAMLRRLVVDLQ